MSKVSIQDLNARDAKSLQFLPLHENEKVVVLGQTLYFCHGKATS